MEIIKVNNNGGENKMGEMTILQPGEIEIYDVVEEINHEHELCVGSMQNSLEHAIRVGELLIQQKEKVNHGDWMVWVKMNCDFQISQANKYMRVFTNYSRGINLESTDSIKGALRIIIASDPKPKKETQEPEQELAISFSWFNDERVTDVYDAMKKMSATITLLKTAKQDHGAAYQILQQWDNGLNKLIEKIRE
jgi:hypothetical protein